MTERKWYAKAIHLLTGLALVLCLALLLVLQAAASPDEAPFYSTLDGYISQSDVSYSGAHDAPTGVVVSGTNALSVGQTGSAAYTVWRGVLFFDTSSLPDDCTISSAVLSLYGHDDDSTVDFDITVVDGSMLDEPLVAADYGLLKNQTVSGGSFNTSDFQYSYNDIPLNETGMAWISKTGTTKFGLRSSKDIAAIVPSGLETASFYTSEEGEGYQPKLVVTCATPVGGVAYPIDKTSVLALWIGLAVLLAGGISWYALKHRRAHS
jgi:hypothetical protein